MAGGRHRVVPQLLLVARHVPPHPPPRQVAPRRMVDAEVVPVPDAPDGPQNAAPAKEVRRNIRHGGDAAEEGAVESVAAQAGGGEDGGGEEGARVQVGLPEGGGGGWRRWGGWR